MRKFKYRAWDIKNKKMIEVVCISLYRFGAEILEFDDGWYIRSIYGDEIPKPFSYYAKRNRYTADIPGNFILMQYTGLKDETGKEIHEGDIVVIRQDITKEILWKDKVFYGKYNIGCNGDEYDFPIHGFIVKNEYLYGKMLDGEVEIIGNIHENPESLK